MMHQSLNSPYLVEFERTQLQMRLAIAEVLPKAHTHNFRNHEKALKVAQSFRDIAESFERFQREISGRLSLFSVEQWNKDRDIVLLYRSAEMLAGVVDHFWQSFEWFRKEHGNLIESHMETTLREFCEWLGHLPKTLRPSYIAYVEAYEADLKEAAKDILEDATLWSSTDGDGLDE